MPTFNPRARYLHGGMAAFNARKRYLHGLGAFNARKRYLRGLGDDFTNADVLALSTVPEAGPNANSPLPPYSGGFPVTPSGPIVSASDYNTALNQPLAPGSTYVGTVGGVPAFSTPATGASAQTWFAQSNQSLGVPNSYLLYGLGAIALLAMFSSRKR